MEAQGIGELVRPKYPDMKVASPWASIFLVWVAVSLLVSPFLVFPLVEGAGVYDNQRMVQMSCALFALLVSVRRWVRGVPRPLLWDRLIATLLGLFFLLGLMSSALAYSSRHAFFEWANLLLMLGMGWMLAAEVSTRGEALLDKLLLAAGLACAAYLLLQILVYLSWLKAGIQPSPRQLIVGYNNYRFFNHVQTISLPLLGLLAARMPDRNRRLFWWGITALWWMLLFVGLGRGTLMGQITGIGITWLLLRQAAAPWCRAMLWAALAGLAAYLLLYMMVPVLMGMAPFGLFSSGVERTVQEPTSGRIPLWTRAWELILASPWLGAGPGHFAHYGRDIPHGAAHPHNWLLQFGSEWGVPALVLLAGAIVLAMHRLWRVREVSAQRDQDTHAAWLVAGWAVLVDGLVSGLLVIPISLLWIVLYIGCTWGWVASRDSSLENRASRPSILQRCAVAVFGLLLIYGLLRSVWPDMQGFSARQPLDLENPVYWPRIWQEGRF